MNTGQNTGLWDTLLVATHSLTHSTMGSESCRPSRLRFCNLEHGDRMLCRVDTPMTEFDRSRCCTRKGLDPGEKERGWARRLSIKVEPDPPPPQTSSQSPTRH